jgi:oxalate decarboxylase/phosphoglucose isomerase-like protein (cupin superfamily)
MTGPNTYEVKRLDEMQRAFGGALARVRAELGITAFGVQVVDLPPNSGDLAPEHDHQHDGQEELYLLLKGSAEVVVPDGTGPQGARVLMIGAVPGHPYVAPANTELGGPETLGATASSAMAPDGPAPQLHH